MKIELKLTIDSLISTTSLLMLVYNQDATLNKQEKVLRSIGFDLADKFDSKTKALQKKASLFDETKKPKITLKFHEAWALEIILIELMPYNTNDFRKNETQKVINQLNQKLT